MIGLLPHRKDGQLRKLIILITIFVSSTVYAADVRLTWTASTSQGVEGYTISYGSGHRNYTTFVDAGNVTEYTITGLSNGKYYFAVRAYKSGEYSRHSNEEFGFIEGEQTRYFAGEIH